MKLPAALKKPDLMIERFDHIEHAIGSIEVRGQFRDLRADMAVDAHHTQARQDGRFFVNIDDLVMRDSELITLQSC